MSSEDRGFKSWSSETLSRIPSGDPGFGRESRSVGKMTGKREGTTPSSAGDSREEEGIANDFFTVSEEFEKVERAARQAGFDAGYAEGKMRAMEDIAPLRDAWIAWAAQLPDFESERLKTMIPSLVTLLETAFRKILGETLSSPASLKGLVERLVGEYAGGRTADLLLSESDYRRIAEHDPDFRKELEVRGVRLEISPDLAGHKVELRFSDRIVSFDPEESAISFRNTLTRGTVSQVSDTPVGSSPTDPDSKGEIR